MTAIEAAFVAQGCARRAQACLPGWGRLRPFLPVPAFRGVNFRTVGKFSHLA
jgi:hypothetical protein